MPYYRSLRCHRHTNPVMWLLGFHCRRCYNDFRRGEALQREEQ